VRVCVCALGGCLLVALCLQSTSTTWPHSCTSYLVWSGRTSLISATPTFATECPRVSCSLPIVFLVRVSLCACVCACVLAWEGVCALVEGGEFRYRGVCASRTMVCVRE